MQDDIQVENTNQENTTHEHTENVEEVKDQVLGEKKAKKALLKLGLNKIENVNRVTLRQKDNYILIVKDPEVYVSKESDSSYVIFGELSYDDEDKKASGLGALNKLQEEGQKLAEKKEEKVEVVEDDTVEESEEGVDKESIEMVMAEAKCTRQKAVKALKRNGMDVVSTILELNN